MRQHQTEVLIVGAGPVGLLAGLILAKAGVKCDIIDREERTAARSYACALHPATLDLLDGLGLSEALIQRGRRITSIAFYDGPDRKAEASLADVSAKFPFVLVLPQSDLEQVLENNLNAAGAKVQWNHRFDSLQNSGDTVTATLEELEGTSLGYIVPHWESVVKRRFPVRALFLVGADGHNSIVRQRLGVAYESLGARQSFVACEFTSDTPGADEVRVVLDETTTNVLWPLPDNKFRWTFQMVHAEQESDFPEKERRAVRFGEMLQNESIRRNLLRLSHTRAPWFSADINEILWCKQVAFEAGLARELGVHGCWLAGDSAHQTGPVGVQSLNAGLSEAVGLARSIEQILKEQGPSTLLSAYGDRCHSEWLRLLGASAAVLPKDSGDSWMRHRARRMLPCLPSVGASLPVLLDHVGLELKSGT